jgi:hypothetical protein
MPHTDFHFVLARSKVGLPAAGTCKLVSAIPIERVAALTRSPRPSARQDRAFLRRGADDLLHDQRAGTPRRPVEKVDFSTATSSSVITAAAGVPHISRAMSKFMTSPS